MNSSSQSQTTCEKSHKYPKVAVFIDGFNLYFGLKDSGLERFLWLDLWRLGEQFLMPGQSLASVYYFTAIVTDSLKRKRQTNYLEALECHTNVSTIFGNFQRNPVSCFKCGHTWDKAEEKKSDVAPATQVLCGAVNNAYDAAVLVTADSDLIPPVQAVKSNWPDKAIFARFPPGRHSHELKLQCDGTKRINESELRRSQLPDTVTKEDGYELKRPATWR
ncbi:6-hydroxy-3-succinoylpyridine 3-monooxygenase HspA [Rubripirellula obstinata]|uniref:6-hydroxy-3-succinoylpyridine 3-monooxygenase HspA n=1 Tax=Rubripirellula obstinata TaxID=406547 RepID=A0A5B1CGX4_9BACT|nr:NYN domain-containing protein [Rubripirellula obstinata]KAA1259461.1 6-hydroxy-3-succinoylpyridine 3-monooxygenase HspA [Rubripirellula obstinata]